MKLFKSSTDVDRNASVLILTRHGIRTTRLAVSRGAIRSFQIMGMVLLVVGAWLLADYVWLKLERNEALALREKTREQRERLSNLRELLRADQLLLAKLKLEKEELNNLKAKLDREAKSLKTKTQEQGERLSSLRERARADRQLLATMKLEKEELNNLKAKHEREAKSLRAKVQAQQKEFSSLQKRIEISHQMLAKWKGLRKKVRDSLPGKRKSSLTGQKVVDDLDESLTSLQDDLEGLIASIPSAWPTKGRVSSVFGMRRSPWTGKSEFHSGTDIANRKGTPVFASGNGVVKFAGASAGNGKSVILNHGQGITTLYGHLSKIHVKEGDRVRKSQKIASVGNTGRSTNPHLHYEVRINRVPIDPRRHLLR